MGYEEGQSILDLDDEIVEQLKIASEKIVLIYSQIDQYTPKSIIEYVCSESPNTKIIYSDPQVSHAFVINSTTTVSNMVAQILVKIIQGF